MIQFIRPNIPPISEWSQYIEISYKEGRYTNFGPVHNLLEKRLTEKYGRNGREAVLVSSGTAGLTAALMGLGIRGKVVIPSFTYAATAQALLLAGCTPVFCDIDPERWELSETSLVEVLRKEKVSAIMPVRSYGFARDFSWLERIGELHHIPVVFDSAAALGGTLHAGIPVGNQGQMEIFSLHATKVFGVGEGGVILCPSAIAQRIRKVIAFGLSEEDVIYPGFNGKMSEFSAAIGMAVLRKIDTFVANRQAYANKYQVAFAPLEERGWIRLPYDPGRCPYQAFPIYIQVEGTESAVLLQKAKQKGLELKRYYFPAIHKTREFSKYAENSAGLLKHTEQIAGRILCLPLYSTMEDSLIERVVEIITRILEE